MFDGLVVIVSDVTVISLPFEYVLAKCTCLALGIAKFTTYGGRREEGRDREGIEKR